MSLTLIGLSSCGEKAKENGTLAESISSQSKAINVDGGESGLEIVVNSSTNWTATSDVAWAKVDAPAGGEKGTFGLHMSFEENATGAERKGTLTLKTVTGGGVCTLPITQAK